MKPIKLYGNSNKIEGWCMLVKGKIKYVPSTISMNKCLEIALKAFNQESERLVRLENVEHEYDELGYRMIHCNDIEAFDISKELNMF